MRIPALLFLLSGALTTAAGCGGTSRGSTPAALRLEREDLVAVSHVLATVQAPVAREVATAKTAWRQIANGLPRPPASARASVAEASDSASRIKAPPLLGEAQSASITGPASQLAGLFSTFNGLTTNGWQMIVAAIEQIEHGSPASARFARENVALYIDSIYDGHFSLAQIGKKLVASYDMLGGQTAFGAALPQAAVDGLARAYSEPEDRLHPHVGVRLGS